jgi:glycosyltransferase involved in cell wall biosynthesis
VRIVVQALPTAPGGGLTLMHDFLEAWPTEDELLVLAWRGATVDALRETGHTVVPVKATSTPEAVARLWRRPALVQRFRPDVVWSQAVRLPWRATPQAVHWRDIGSFAPVHRRSVRRRVRRLRESSDLRRADLRVFNSHAILEAAVASQPEINHLPSVVVPNGLRLEPFSAVADRPAIDDGILRIILPQSDSPHKQNGLAADVVARVTEDLPPKFCSVRLLVPGAGVYLDLADRLAQHGLGHTLELRGPLDRRAMADLYAESNVVLITSRGESFCNPAIEAAAVGRPLVAPPIPALRESGGPMARLAGSWDAAALAEALKLAVDARASASLLERAFAHAGTFTAAASSTALRTSLSATLDRCAGPSSNR